MYLEAFNSNLYLRLVSRLEDGLKKIQVFIDAVIEVESLSDLEGLAGIYKDIFSDPELNDHIDFAISRTHKELYFREVEFNRTNSYYHLKLIIISGEAKWLDSIYNGALSRLLKYYKALFSKIDNIFSNTNVKQKEIYQKLIQGADFEIEKLNIVTAAKNDINSEKKRLRAQYLEKIPFPGLFHITHVSNIPGILERGILSHTRAYQSGLFKTDISNQSINQKRSRPESINNYSIHDYAPLYINPQNPMLESLCLKRNLRDKLILIQVSPNILVKNNGNVLFTDGNAAEESSSFYNSLEDFNKLNWELLSDAYYLHHSDGKRIKCSEVLVQDYIDIPYIDKLLTFSEANFESLYTLFPNHMNIELEVNKEIFL